MADGSLLAEVIEAHGGIERWKQIDALRLSVRVGGKILALKFTSPLIRSLECTISTQRVYIAVRPFPHPGSTGILDGNTLRIESDEGTAMKERRVLRLPEGRVPWRPVWDDLDVLYFLGYALWNYANTPFIFLWPGFESREAGSWQEKEGEIWRKLCVTYPAGFPTHSRQQAFYFDSRRLLRRLDYTAEVFGSSARGAHYCEEHKELEGLIFPTHRTVFVRLDSGHPLRLFSVMEGWIDKVTIA
jgi:hypothetical protein